MHSYKEIIKFGAPLKSVEVVPENPPPPPPPTFSQNEVAEREANARQQATQETADRMNREIAQLREQTVALQQGILSDMENKFNAMVADINARIPNLVLGLTRRVLAGHTMDVETVQNIIMEAVSEVSSEKEQIEVSLSEPDFQLMKAHGGDFVQQHPNMTFKKDANLTPGDCLLNSRFGLVDARVEKKLSKIEADFKKGAQ